MNPLDQQLDRLFRAAAQPGTVEPAPFGLETRAVAAWRASTPGTVWSTGILVRGLVLASLIMGVSLWTALEQKSNSDSEYLQLTDSTAQTDYP
jgi:hypothetical protein